MERVILVPGRARARTLARKLQRRATSPAPLRPEAIDTRDVAAVVLGGGRGTRLFPLTDGRAKPFVSVGGTCRLVDISISNALASGVDRVLVLTQWNAASLNAHVAATYANDGSGRRFVEALSPEQSERSQDWYLGTADAVRKQLARIRATGAREVLILAGDHLYRMDYREFLARHREARADVTVAVTHVPRREASQFGLLRVDEDDRIVEFAEKPSTIPASFGITGPDGSEGCLASMGIYIFDIEALESLLAREGAIDFGAHVIPAAIGERKVAAFRFAGYWEDMGTIASYHRASLRLTQPEAGHALLGARYTRPSVLPPARIDGASLRATLVSEGSVIEEDVILERSVLGPRSVVRRESRIEQTVMLGATRAGDPSVGVGARCFIRRAILDEDVRVGNDVILENRAGLTHHDGEHLFVRDGIIVLPRGARVPDGYAF
jgi:glucose-1-phosphate adenylyltransferase